nr:hypothetical protein L203_03853 [Cryptococcus depauperatus CBS 7841]
MALALADGWETGTEGEGLHRLPYSLQPIGCPSAPMLPCRTKGMASGSVCVGDSVRDHPLLHPSSLSVAKEGTCVGERSSDMDETAGPKALRSGRSNGLLLLV